VVIPTLAADEALGECLRSLDRQTWRDFLVVVADNSGRGAAPDHPGARILRNSRNLGFGGAINEAFRSFPAEFLATLNDDAIAHERWLEEMIRVLDADAEAGMCAPRILLDAGRLDSAGLLLCGDGVAKQRGHGAPPGRFQAAEDVLMPSGAAAMYRKSMLDAVGLFDESFFLYCEDSDLGLRARWAGWRCVFAPAAEVTHRYSHSAGPVSGLKAYLVERNRLRVAVKNFPFGLLMASPWVALRRYFWHATGAGGSASRYRQAGGSGFLLAWWVMRAHLSLLVNLPRLLAARRAIRETARVTAAQFTALPRQFSISPREVASQ